MPFLELFDETLDINSTENYELTVQITINEISFCILDSLRRKFVLLRSYEPDDDSGFDHSVLSEIIKKDDFLTRQYKKTILITPSPKSTLVPGPLYDDSKKDDYFAFNQSLSDGEKILVNKLRDPDIFVIFSLPEWIRNVLNSTFPGKRPMHQLKPLLHYTSSARRAHGNMNIHVHLEGDYVNIIIFDQNILKLCNTFHFRTRSDIEYYVLYVLKRMNIRNDEAIFFSGRITVQNNLLNSFSGFLNNIRMALPSENYTYTYVLNDTELSRFLNIFNAVNCE
jgi:hypothetical protein